MQKLHQQAHSMNALCDALLFSRIEGALHRLNIPNRDTFDHRRRNVHSMRDGQNNRAPDDAQLFL
tara:strand:+ start:560 stop:754 length:195 start_codon:yes stop_codon:yes gene_type:complete